MVDYTVWDKIEVSDDEDETHPNIDTASLFRWRHQARLQRMQEYEEKMTIFEKKKDAHKINLQNAKESLENAENSKMPDSVISTYRKTLNDLIQADECIIVEETELLKEKKSQPWNVDTISKPGFDKTIKNTTSTKVVEPKKKDTVQDLNDFTAKHKPSIMHYAMLSCLADSKQYLLQNPFLACEETANFLCIYCIDLAVDKKFSLLDRVAYQTISIQFLLQLADYSHVSPSSIIDQFFGKLARKDPELNHGFNAELTSFIEKVKGRADARIHEAVLQVEEEEKEKRLGPGGLDPQEVFETLPSKMQECFKKQNIELLKKVISEMPTEQANYHFQRCIESGLWVPDENSEKEDNE